MPEKLVFMEKLENLYSYCIYNFLVFIQIFIHQQLHGFHMVVTRSPAKSESMSDISEEIRKYFSELIKPLATNTSLKEMFDKMKEEVISKFESKICEQNNKIYELESRVAIQEKIINNLLTKCEDNEQYSRRSCLRIHGIESNSNEKNQDVIEKIRECYNALELPFNEEVIDRAHRVGKEYTDKISKKTVRSIIVKFKSFSSFIMLDQEFKKMARRNRVKISVFLLI